MAKKRKELNKVDSLVLADIPAPSDTKRRTYEKGKYFKNLKAWVNRGGNLVLTDRSLHALADLGIVPKESIQDIKVYQPHANFRDFEHELASGLRPNARQLVEAAVLGYGIGNDASPMTIVATEAWEGAGGHVIGTTATATTGEDPAADRLLDDGSFTSVGELALGKGKIRIIGGALPMPSEELDHRFGLRNYGLTYSGVYLMENAIKYNVKNLGKKRKKKG